MARIRNRLIRFSIPARARGRLATLLFCIYLIALLCTRTEAEIVLPSIDTPVCIYSNQDGDDLRQTLKSAIEAAQVSIHIAIYSLTDPVIMDAIRKKAQQGVHVTIIADQEASPNDLASKLGPDAIVTKKNGQGLMLHKIIVIDGCETWLGSTNLTRDSLSRHGNILVGVRSEALGNFVNEKLCFLLKPQLHSSHIATLPGSQQSLQLFFLPQANTALDKLIQVIDSAQKTVRVAIYTFTHAKLIAALTRAHQRGVSVTCAFDRDSTQRTSQQAFTELTQAGVATWVNARPGLLHYKMMIVDDELLVAGSANWTRAAFEKNDDNILIIHPLQQQQKEKINHLWNNILKEAQPGIKNYEGTAYRVWENGQAHPYTCPLKQHHHCCYLRPQLHERRPCDTRWHQASEDSFTSAA